MNRGASIRAKLSYLARSKNVAFQVLIFRYLHERFLFRLSQSAYRDNFFLKGGVLLFAFDNEITRPTKDIDFLGDGINNDMEEVKLFFQEICKITDDDAVWFDPETISVEMIKEDDQYEGVRLYIEGGFDTIKQRIQIDVGFGDIIIPDVQVIEFPVLLPETKVPILKAYSKESVIAEKFHAMVDLSYTNSRMKDFYDVYNLLEMNQFDRGILKKSIEATFNKRLSSFTQIPSFFEDEFKNDNKLNKLWKQFLDKNKLNKNLEFPIIVEVIVNELKPIWNELH